MSPLETEALSEHTGVRISGIDLSGGVDEDTVRQLIQLLYQHAIICISEQVMTPTQLAEFAQRLGTPVPHVEESLHLDGISEVMSLSNADDRDDRQLNGGAHWHTDLIHTDEPASFTMLNAVAVPASGGRTLFANQAQAYDSLSVEKQELYRELVIQHCYEGRTDGSMPVLEYPLVRQHPVTGRPALYGACGTGIGIAGQSEEEFRRIYRDVSEYATGDDFIYRHQYHLHDLVIWDNSQLLHAAEVLARSKNDADRRIMHRVSVRGWPGA